MIEKLVFVILALGLIGGIAGMMLVLAAPILAPQAPVPDPASSIRKQKWFARSFHTFSVSLAGLFFLLVHLASPLEILLGVVVVRGLIEVGVSNWRPKAIRHTERIAVDRTTGEVIGQIIGETRNCSTGAVEAFRIQNETGSLIERSVDSITIRSG